MNFRSWLENNGGMIPHQGGVPSTTGQSGVPAIRGQDRLASGLTAAHARLAGQFPPATTNQYDIRKQLSTQDRPQSDVDKKIMSYALKQANGDMNKYTQIMDQLNKQKNQIMPTDLGYGNVIPPSGRPPQAAQAQVVPPARIAQQQPGIAQQQPGIAQQPQPLRLTHQK